MSWWFQKVGALLHCQLILFQEVGWFGHKMLYKNDLKSDWIFYHFWLLTFSYFSYPLVSIYTTRLLLLFSSSLVQHGYFCILMRPKNTWIASNSARHLLWPPLEIFVQKIMRINQKKYQFQKLIFAFVCFFKNYNGS